MTTAATVTLAGLGYGDGSRIAILSETRPEFCELYVACAKLGVTLVTLNIRFLPDEIAGCIDLAVTGKILRGELARRTTTPGQVVEATNA
jgi:fatty-acyl-CoA synthase